MYGLFSFLALMNMFLILIGGGMTIWFANTRYEKPVSTAGFVIIGIGFIFWIVTIIILGVL